MLRTSIFLRWLCVLLLMLSFCASAETVHVYAKRNLNGQVSILSDSTIETLTTYSSPIAAAVNDYIFTGWTLENTQDFNPRDHYGRAKESVDVKIYEETVLIANYLPNTLDSDNDGIPDGWEMYWFGNLDNGAEGDVDEDGYNNLVEWSLGMNPHMSNRSIRRGIVSSSGNVVAYNPDRIHTLTIRSEPEGVLFATSSEFVRAGTIKTTASYNYLNTKFAYWMVDGVRQADGRGRAKDSVSFTMPEADMEVVAVCITDPTERKIAYWYGEDVTMDSDTDGDGYSLITEFALGTNPLMPNRTLRRGIVSSTGDVVQYNPDCISKYTIRSEPDGVLFDTKFDYAKKGTVITTPSYSPSNSRFAYWTINGVRQADSRGRALDSVKYTMQMEEVEIIAVCIDDTTNRKVAYWYNNDQTLDSDTDGDGYSLAVELALGTNPLLAERKLLRGIVSASGITKELNLQVYEQAQGALIGDQYSEIFTSPIAGNVVTSETFGDGSQIWPVVADVNDDGKWDLVVCWEKESEGVKSLEFRVYLNVGSVGNPEFVVGRDVSIPPSVDLMMNSTAKLAVLTLDVAPINALSATTNGATLLVSDTEGRIWFYEGAVVASDQSLVVSSQESGVSGQELGVSNSKLQTLNYQLKHKVWGGSHAGFANGLTLAAVDWEDDGDLDCICGTAEGKLMLLRNPKVGRPTNLKALVGIDNVLLTWDPNQQSRIRGYKVYREEGNGNGYVALVPGVPNVSTMYTTALPRYRDFPNSSTPNFSYKVSSISRFYTAGNSAPTITESPATEAVCAELGTVKFFWNDVVCKLGENANVMLSIENSMNFDVAGKTQTVKYDPMYLRPLKIAKTGLTENVTFTESFADGEWQIAMTGGTLPAGGGKFLTLVFETLKEGETTVGGDGGATVTIAAADSENPTDVPPYSLGDVNGDGRLDKEDVRELARLKNGNGRKHTANQLKAGDFNGNGKLDDADYQALRELLKEKGLL